LTYSPKTTNEDISVLQQILSYAMSHELIDSNPAAQAPRPKLIKRKWRILTPEEIRKVDQAFDTIEFLDTNGRWDEQTARKQAQLMFRVLTRTGLRRDEIRRLLVDDLDLEKGTLRVTISKTDEGERSIALPKSLAGQLKEWVENKRRGEYVFTSSRGNMVGGQWYTDQFNKALLAAGITDYVRPFHDMRHTALTNEAATGKSSPIALMAKAGHRSMSTTRQYLQLAGVVFHEEAEALEERYSNGD
jgi:integrase